MNNNRIITALAGVLLAIITICYAFNNASAQTSTPPPPCAPRDLVIANLENAYGEHVRNRAMVHLENTILEVLVSENGDTWTIIGTNISNNISCLLSSGTNWVNVEHGPRV